MPFRFRLADVFWLVLVWGAILCGLRSTLNWRKAAADWSDVSAAKDARVELWRDAYIREHALLKTVVAEADGYEDEI